MHNTIDRATFETKYTAVCDLTDLSHNQLDVHTISQSVCRHTTDCYIRPALTVTIHISLLPLIQAQHNQAGLHRLQIPARSVLAVERALIKINSFRFFD